MTKTQTKFISWVEKAGLWLHRPEGVARLWLGKYSALVAWLGLGLAAFSPPTGTGLPLCFYQAMTGLPCLGCGLTRSLSCGLRGLFTESLQYHPMGLIILVLFCCVAGLSLAPSACRQWVVQYVDSRPLLFKGLYLGFVTVFVCYGTFRALAHLALHGAG